MEQIQKHQAVSQSARQTKVFMKCLWLIVVFVLPTTCFAAEQLSPQEKTITKTLGGILAAVIAALVWWLNGKIGKIRLRRKKEKER